MGNGRSLPSNNNTNENISKATNCEQLSFWNQYISGVKCYGRGNIQKAAFRLSKSKNRREEAPSECRNIISKMKEITNKLSDIGLKDLKYALTQNSSLTTKSDYLVAAADLTGLINKSIGLDDKTKTELIIIANNLRLCASGGKQRRKRTKKRRTRRA